MVPDVKLEPGAPIEFPCKREYDRIRTTIAGNRDAEMALTHERLTQPGPFDPDRATPDPQLRADDNGAGGEGTSTETREAQTPTTVYAIAEKASEEVSERRKTAPGAQEQADKAKRDAEAVRDEEEGVKDPTASGSRDTSRVVGKTTLSGDEQRTSGEGDAQ